MNGTKTIIDYYHDILSGDRKRFPTRTWDQTDSKKELIKLTRYIILELLKMDRADILANVCLEFFVEHKIGSAVRRCYKQDVASFIIDSFPELKIKHWEFKRTCVPVAYWNNETLVEATKWLIEDVLKWDSERVRNEISNTSFFRNGLSGMLQTLNMGAIDAVVLSYPDVDWTYLIERRGYRITKQQAEEIREMYSSGSSMYEIARKYRVSAASVFHVVHNSTFKSPVTSS